ncbi:hypothetical protein ABTC78_19410, partial [Acinetobacter baumannii]
QAPCTGTAFAGFSKRSPGWSGTSLPAVPTHCREHQIARLRPYRQRQSTPRTQFPPLAQPPMHVWPLP